MDANLNQLGALGRPFTRHDAQLLGLSADDLRRLVKTGACCRIRRGHYVVARRKPGRARAEDVHANLTKAVLADGGRRIAASHQSAAAIVGLPLWGYPLNRVHAVRVVGSHRGSGGKDVIIHPPVPVKCLAETDFGLVVKPEVAGLQIAMKYGVEPGCVTIDAGLHDNWFTEGDLHRALEQLAGRPRHSWAVNAASLCDRLAESPGESRLRVRLWALGHKSLESQVVFASGGHRDRVDFFDREHGIVIEFDGLLKYRGKTGDALIEEKRREDRLRALGYEVVRFTWADLDTPGALARAMRAAIARSRRS